MMITGLDGRSFSLYCIVFCAALFLTLSVSPPAFHFNDEWITANQLHQLATGHQVVTNEGKYGTFLGNQATEYFTTRSNILGYSLFLPVLSLPAYYLFVTLNTSFRLAVLLVWLLLPVIIALLVHRYYPRYARIYRIPWTWLLVGVCFIGFIWNLAVFTPFLADGSTDPVEAAAIIFTDHILFGILAMIFLYTGKLLFDDECFSVFGVIALICSSSYLYWSSSAKDHMLVAVIFAGIVASTLAMVKKEQIRYAVLSFLGCGLLAWVRPELALVFFIGSTILYVGFLSVTYTHISNKRLLLTLLLIPLIVLAGAIPFFVNNSLITGNPLTPVFLFMQDDSEIEQSPLLVSFSVTKAADESPFHVSSFILLVSRYFTPKWDTLLPDLQAIFCNPPSGMMSILGICPLFSIGLVLLFLKGIQSVIRKKIQISYMKETIVCIIAIFVVFLAYINGFHGLITSMGIGPDLRYLSPLYFPAGLIGLIGIRQLYDYQKDTGNSLKRIGFTIILMTPAIFLSMLLFPPYDGGFYGYTRYISLVIFILVILFLLVVFCRKTAPIPAWTNQITLGLTLSFPLVWNLILIIMFSVTRGNGYPFWLPVVERLFTFFIIPIG